MTRFKGLDEFISKPYGSVTDPSAGWMVPKSVALQEIKRENNNFATLNATTITKNIVCMASEKVECNHSSMDFFAS